jgi:hypothetical protein
MGFLTISLNVLYFTLNHTRTSKQHKKRNYHEDDETQIFHRRRRYHHHHVGNSTNAAMTIPDTKVTLEELHLQDDDDDALAPIDVNITLEQARRGKEPLLDLLREAGVNDSIHNVHVIQRLPLWSIIVRDLFGPGPVVWGEETCAAFRHSVPPSVASLGVAGMFNTGTNLVASYLEQNCILPLNKNNNAGIRWQVPWGKHMLASWKWTNTANHESKTDKTTVLPVVLVRDPYSWMKSMCRNHYGARWHYTKEHCPNLVPNQHDLQLFPYQGSNIPVRLDYGGGGGGDDSSSSAAAAVNITSYDSLAHLWSEWNRQYWQVDYPRIMVRYEDVLFYPRELITRICTCAGGVTAPPHEFTYFVNSAKWGPGHGKEEQKTSLISAMMKYANVAKRIKGYTKEDLQLAHEALSEDLMIAFQYNRPLEQNLLLSTNSASS